MKIRTFIYLCICCVSAQAQNLIQNGGFEVQNPAVQTAPPTYSIFPVSGLPNWSTTAGDQMVEVWSSGYSSQSGGPVYAITTPDGFYPNGGKYFAELNANQVSTLYQTVTLNATGALSYSFWHRGRAGMDTMALSIESLMNGTWQQVYYKQFTTGQNWVNYTAQDVAVGLAGQQFRFKYVSVAGTTTSVGNFLDNAAFGLLNFFTPITPGVPSTNPTAATPIKPSIPREIALNPSTPQDPMDPSIPGASPELMEIALQGFSFQAGLADQSMSQVRQIGPELYNRFALARAQHQQGIEDVQPPTSFGSDFKSVKDPKQVSTPGKSFKTTLNGQETTIEAPEHLPWTLWGQGNGILSDSPSLGSVPSQNSAGGAFLVGLDYHVTRDLTVGIYSGYLMNRQKFGTPTSSSSMATSGGSTGGGSVWTDGLAYGGYLSYSRPKGGLYGDVAIGGGGFTSSASRPIDLYGESMGNASSKPTANFFMIYTDTGYDWKIGRWTFGPVGSLQYSQLNSPSIQETDPLGLNMKYNSQQLYSLFMQAGGHINYCIPLTRSVHLLPEVRCFWNREFYQASRDMTGSYQSMTMPEYLYTDNAVPPNSFNPSAGFSLTLGKDFSTSLFYSAGVGSGISVQALTLTAGYSF
jgi:hypothetical protein